MTSLSLTELYSLFTSILATFPVCHARKFYLQILNSPFKLKSICVDSPNRGIFHAMLDLLHDLIRDDSPVQQKPLKKCSFDNFYLWDEQNDEKFSFAHFPREEKFSRVFAILDLLTTLMEADLAMFIIKFSRRLRSSILNENHQPLICAILWQSYESVIIVNSTIKSIIEAFVTMTALNYPPENLRVVSRLLNLVAQVTNLYEYPDETFEYPSYGSLTMDLIRTIQKSLESSSKHSVELYIAVAENLRSPLLRMLLMNEVIGKIRGKNEKISLEIPFESIRHKEWIKFKDAGSLEKAETAKVAAELTSITSGPPVYSRFLTANSNLKPKKLEITQKSCLKVLLIFAAAINDFYHIQVSVKEMHESKIEPIPATDSTSFVDREPQLDDNNLEEKVTMRKPDLNFKKLVHIKLSLDTCTFYRNEIKYFMILPKLIKKCSEKFGEQFDDWMELVKSIEA